MSDRIVYIVVVKPGGIDGMDSSNKGGPKYASFDRADAEKHVDAWSELKVDVIENVEKRAAQVVKGLPPIDRLLLKEYSK